MDVVLTLIRHQKTLMEICRENNLKPSEVERWKEDFLQAGRQGLRTKKVDHHHLEVKELREKVGELTLEIDARKKFSALVNAQRKPSL